MLGRHELQPVNPPTCLPELRRALLDEWYKIPQDQIDNLILSMPRRCVAVPELHRVMSSANIWILIPEEVTFSIPPKYIDESVRLRT
ncbi:hypothetical protein TNCV_605011 [Trichonephila clavipes]|nr:hypothetical protein TNCV_605011 [Trichonephila clavipes]